MIGACRSRAPTAPPRIATIWRFPPTAKALSPCTISGTVNGSLTQQTTSPEIPDRLLIPAPGVAGALAYGRLRIGGVTRPGPGAIQSVAMHLYDAIVVGDFEGVFVLPPDGELYRLAAGGPESVVASGQDHIAVSGRSGTALFNLGIEDRLTASGRKLSWVALALMILAAMLVCGPFLLSVFFRAGPGRLRDGRRAALPTTLGVPPPELIKMCANGDAILWAGTGLSAQSGFPLRAAFIATVLQAAVLEKWVDASRLQKLSSLLSRGDGELALDQLAAAMRSQRGALVSHCTAIYARFGILSRSHELLARLNFGRAITTNYDMLLEQMQKRWASGVATLAAGSAGDTPLLKLYGALHEPSTLLLSRAEFKNALDGPGRAGLRRTLDESPVLFLGCSAEGLLADLETIGATVSAAQPKRYALIAVSAAAWTRQAEQLWRLYGIETLACSSEKIQGALPGFPRKPGARRRASRR